MEKFDIIEKLLDIENQISNIKKLHSSPKGQESMPLQNTTSMTKISKIEGDVCRSPYMSNFVSVNNSFELDTTPSTTLISPMASIDSFRGDKKDKA